MANYRTGQLERGQEPNSCVGGRSADTAIVSRLCATGRNGMTLSTSVALNPSKPALAVLRGRAVAPEKRRLRTV